MPVSAAPLPICYPYLITVASLPLFYLYVSHQLFLSLSLSLFLLYSFSTALPHSTGFSKQLPCHIISHTEASTVRARDTNI